MVVKRKNKKIKTKIGQRKTAKSIKNKARKKAVQNNPKSKIQWIKVSLSQSRLSPHIIDLHSTVGLSDNKINLPAEPVGQSVDFELSETLVPLAEKSSAILSAESKIEYIAEAKTDESFDLPKLDFVQVVSSKQICRDIFQGELAPGFVKKFSNWGKNIFVFSAKTDKFKQDLVQYKLIDKFFTVWARPLATFLIVCLVIIIPIRVLGVYQNYQSTKEEFSELVQNFPDRLAGIEESLNDFNLDNLGQEAAAIKSDLLKAKEKIKENGAIMVALSKLTSQGSTANNLTDAGLSLTGAVENLSKILSNFLEDFDRQSVYPDENGENASEIKFTDQLRQLNNDLNQVYQDLKQSNKYLKKTDLLFVSADFNQRLDSFKQKLISLENYFAKYLGFTEILPQILGEKEMKRYLVIFQNSNEIRPTGGFMGSFALVDFVQGKIKNLEILPGGFYDLEGQMTQNIKPPKPILLVNQRWEIQDANWWADFPTSAEKIIRFYTQCNGPTVDGVIGLNVELIPALLELTGPIELKEYDKVINSENFISEIQQAVEIDYDKEENKPKQIIADLTPKLIEKIFSLFQDENKQRNFLDILGILESSLAKKDIQIYLTDQNLQEKIKAMGWSGDLKNSEGDYLMVVDTNLRGGKTDGVIKKDLFLKTNIKTDGTIINELSITRQHLGDPENYFEKEQNIVYLRVYVPKSSILLESSGFDPPGPGNFYQPLEMAGADADIQKFEDGSILDKNGTLVGQELGKTVFGNWLVLNPGEKITATITYQLPFKWLTEKIENKKGWLELAGEKIGLSSDNADSLSVYNLLIQKQSGNQNTSFYQELFLPYQQPIVWQYPGDVQAVEIAGKQKFVFSRKLESDQYWGIAAEIEDETKTKNQN